MNVVSPMIFDSSGSVLRRIDPVDVSLDLQLEPLSSAEIELKPGDTIPERSWVSVYTEHGLAGIFRSRPQRDRYGERSSRVSLVHGAVELNDYLTTKGGDQEQDPANTAIAYIMQFYLGTHWRLGTVSATSSVVYQLNGSGVLDAITEIMEQLPGYMLVFDQSVTPWTLNVLPRPETVSAEGRLSRNISSVEISRDDSSLCTRVYYGENDLFVEDAAAIQKYGVIEYRINDSGLTNSQLAAIAQAYLDNHKASKLSVSISAIDFYNATGEPIDRIALGSKYRLAIPDAETEENRVIEAIICSIHYDSVFSNNPQITLASDPDTIINFLKKQRRSGGSARQLAKEEADKQYQHWTTENNVYKESVYKIMGVVLDENGNVVYQKDPVTGELILDDAGNPKPVYDPNSGGSLSGVTRETAQNYTRLYELTGVNALGENETILTRVQQNARQYAVEAVQNNMSGYLLINNLSTEMGNVLQTDKGTIGAKIATAVNAQTGDSIVTIDASKVNITGLVTMTQLESVEGKIDTVRSETITANTYLSAGTGKFNTLWVESPGANGSTNTAQVNNAINSITPYTPSDPGKIGFKYTTLANPVGQPVDFNIADTEYYRNHVGIEATGLTVTEIGQTPYNNHSAEAITTPEIKAGTSDKYYLISATAKDGTTTVYKKFTLPAASAPPVTASIDDITGTSIAANHIKDTSIPLTASGTNVAAYTENLTLEETTYQVGSITRPCVVLKLDGSVIGRIYTGNSYNRGWDAAADVVVLPVSSASPGQSMALSVPYARTANGTTTRGTDQITYTLRVDQKYAYISTVGGNDSVINYAKYEHNQYTLGQDSVSASLPTGTPPAGTNASELSPGTYALTLTKGSTPSVLGYYTVPAAAVVTPKVSKGNWSGGSIKFTAGTSGEDEATVALKMSVDTGTNKSTVIKVLDGQTETGNSMTVYLKADNDNCYITSTDYTPNANNTLARITNPKTAPAASIDSIALRTAGGVQYVYDDVERIFTVYLKATGTNVAEKTGEVDIPAASAIEHGKRLVSAVLAETASSAAAPSTLVSGKTYNLYRVVDGTRESKAVSSYTVPAAAAPVSASIDDLSGVAIDDDKERDIIPISARGTNVTSRSENVTLKRSTYGSAGNKCVTLTMDGVVIGRISAQTFYTEGRNSVKITNVERVASCDIDDDAQTAEQDVRFTLSNGETYTIHEDFSDVYRAGRNGTAIDTFVDYAVDLASGGVVFDPGVEEDADGDPLRVYLDDIYQEGQNYKPAEKHWYTYSPTGGDVPIYVRGGGSGSGDGVIGSIYEHLNQFHASTSIAFYPYTPVEVVGSLLGYTQVSYGGKTYYVDPSNLKQSETDLSIGHRTGIKDLTVTRTITLSRIVHTAGTSNSVTLTVQREGERNPSNAVSSYVSLREFNNLTVNDNAGKYFDYLSYLSGYYASHDPKVYGDTITHKAVFTETYVENGQTITEYIVVSFDSYAYVAENEVLWWEITNYYNNYSDNVPVTFTPSNASTAQTLPYSEGYSSLTVTDMNADYYIPGDITYPWSAKYPQMTCRFRIRCHLSDGTTEDVIIKKIAHREEAPSQDAFIGYVYATNGGSVKVRATAGGSEIGSLTPRTEVTVLEKAGSYYKIEFEGVQGYMATAYVSTSSASKSNFSYTGWLKDVSYVEIDATESGTDRLVHNGGYTGTIITTLKLPGHNNSYNYRSTNGATLNIFNTHYANPITGSLGYYLGTVNNKGNIATHSQVYKSNLTHRARISVYYADGTNETLNIEFTSVPG